jgi:5-methyltetrahydrofolate--homocysteine methyltransferase
MTMQPDRTAELTARLEQHILILDGAMGTMIQRYTLSGGALPRRAFLAAHAHDLKGNNDLLLADPAAGDPRDPRGLPGRRSRHHRDQHLQRDHVLRQADYHLEAWSAELNVGRRPGLARAACDKFTRSTRRPRVSSPASLGPTSAPRRFRRTSTIRVTATSASTSCVGTYAEQPCVALIEGGADILLVETIFDTLNAKAALFAIDEHFEREAPACTGCRS